MADPKTPSQDGPCRDFPLRRAGVLAGGALLILLALGPGGVSFGQVPLLTGVVYLAAAYAGGAAGALWVPGCLVTGWGVGNALLALPLLAPLRAPESAAHMVGFGLGVLLLVYLQKIRGVSTSLVSVGVTLLLAGFMFTLQRGQGVALLNEAAGYSLLLTIYALGDVGVWLWRRRLAGEIPPG